MTNTTTTTRPGTRRAPATITTNPFGMIGYAVANVVANHVADGGIVNHGTTCTFATNRVRPGSPVSGMVVRTIGIDHPAAIDVIAAIDAGRTADATMRSTGTGKGHARVDFIDHGMRTATDAVRRFRCNGIVWPNGNTTACVHDDAPRVPADGFPTYTTVRADGAVRNVAECRRCRDTRVNANRGMAADDIRRIPVPTAIPVDVNGNPV